MTNYVFVVSKFLCLLLCLIVMLRLIYLMFNLSMLLRLRLILIVVRCLYEAIRSSRRFVVASTSRRLMMSFFFEFELCVFVRKFMVLLSIFLSVCFRVRLCLCELMLCFMCFAFSSFVLSSSDYSVLLIVLCVCVLMFLVMILKRIFYLIVLLC